MTEDIVKCIIEILERDPSKYNKKDIYEIINGKKKGYTPKYNFTISLSRISGFLDAIELFAIIQKNEKRLFSLVENSKERLGSLGIKM